MFARIRGAYAVAYGGHPREIWALAIACFVNRAGTMVVPFISLYLQTERGLSAELIASLLLMFGLGSLAGSLIGGWAIAWLGWARTVYASLWGVAVAFLLFPLAESLPALFAGIFAISCVGDIIRPAGMAGASAHAAPGRRTQALGLVRTAVNAGMVLGPALGGWLAVQDYSWLFVGDAITCAAAGVLLWFGLRGSRRPAATSPTRPMPPRLRHTAIWRDLPFVAFLMLSFLVAACMFQAFFVMPLFLHEVYGYSEANIGLLFGVQAAIIVVFEMLLIHRLQRYPSILVFAIGGLLTGVGLASIAIDGRAIVVYSAIAVWSVGEMLSMPFAADLVAERAGPRLGPYMGLYNAVFAGAQIVAPALGLGIRAWWGWPAVWSTVALCGVVTLGGSWLLRHSFQRTAPS